MSALPTTAQLQAAFVKWFNALVIKPSLLPRQVPAPGLTDAPDLTLAQVQALLSTVTNGGLPSTAKLYQAVISQTGTDAPTAQVLQNTLGGTLVFARGDVGVYSATLAGAFPAFTTAIIPGAVSFEDLQSTEFRRVSDNEIGISTFDIINPAVPTSADSLLTNAFLQIITF